MLIEWAGHEVLSAENGAMGLELFKSTHLLTPVDPEKLRSVLDGCQ